MGNDSSKQTSEADLRYLRDRLPFDEAELVRLVSIYDDHHHHDDARSSHDPSSSIATWSSSSSSSEMPLCQWSSPKHTGVTLPDDTNNGQKEEEDEEQPLDLGQLLARVERDILPPQFGAQLAHRVLHVSPTTPTKARQQQQRQRRQQQYHTTTAPRTVGSLPGGLGQLLRSTGQPRRARYPLSIVRR